MESNIKKRTAFTLIEMMVTILVASIVVLAIGGVMADAHRGYNKMYTRVHGNIVNQAHESRVVFDRICRKSSRFYKTDTGDPTELYVYYYSDSANPTLTTSSPMPDSYAKFYLSGTNLLVDYGIVTQDEINGTISPQAPTSSPTLANNVTSVVFLQPESSSPTAQMILTLYDPALKQGLTVTCSSVRHN